MISVVIPAYNAAATIGSQLEALHSQSCEGQREVIVADNGSTDGTVAVVESWRDRIPALRVVDASARRGAAAARNIGAAAAAGELLAFCDADDTVAPGWLDACAAALSEHSFIAGAMDHDSMNPGAAVRWHVHSHVTAAPQALRFKPYALSSNMAVRRAAFEEVGGFPEDLGAAGEDVAISWELQLAGHDLHFAPGAVVAYRHRSSLADLWRQYRAYGYADPVLYARYRSYGVPRLGALRALRAYLLLLVRLPRLLRAETRGSWVAEAAKRWGRLVGSMRQRVLYL